MGQAYLLVLNRSPRLGSFFLGNALKLVGIQRKLPLLSPLLHAVRFCCGRAFLYWSRRRATSFCLDVQPSLRELELSYCTLLGLCLLPRLCL